MRGYLTGSLDAVLRLPGPRYLVVDYKTNWLGDVDGPTAVGVALPAGGADRGDGAVATIRCRRCCTALRCTASCAGGSPAYDPEQHLGGVLYLYVRGMSGAATPVVDGHPCGVFSWRPPAALVVAMSILLDGGAAVTETPRPVRRRLALRATGMLRELNRPDLLTRCRRPCRDPAG